METTPGEFFREVTLKICSSLDINIALQRTFQYLRQVLPLDGLFLDIHDPQLGAIRRIAYAGAQGGEPTPPEIIPLPEEVWSWAQGLDQPIIVDSTNADSMVRRMAAITRNKGKSDMPVPLRIEGKTIGILVLRANGEGRYRKEHADLVRLVGEPFAIALSNTLAHQELLHLRDILIDDNRFLQRELSPGVADAIVGEGSGLRNVMESVRQVAPLNNTVLLLGETGVGKEVVANAIHYGSPRRNGPFIKVNCGAIAESLIDSELFGHEKGAFTGALTEKRGRFERADGGTLFLDEIGELPPQAQVRLLRVLQTRELERVGGTKPIPIDIRIIAATHRNLEQMIADAQFREDLWFRINVFPIFLPPLRQRREDIPALTRHLVQVKSRELGLAKVPSIAPGALERLTNYEWPGNVRELQNIIERELIRYRTGSLTFEAVGVETSAKQEQSEQKKVVENDHVVSLDDAMAQHIRKAIDYTKGRINGKGGAADILGIHPSTLRSRMEKLGITRTEG